MKLDVSRLTLGEIATIEDLAGQPITTVTDEDRPKGKMLASLVMITKRRDGFPTFKFGDALALNLEEAYEVLGMNDEENDEESDDDTAVEEPGDIIEERPTSARTAAPRKSN